MQRVGWHSEQVELTAPEGVQRIQESGRSVLASIVQRALTILPRGNSLPDESWRRRHQVIVAILWLHVLGLFALGLARGVGSLHSLSEASVVAIFAITAGRQGHSHRFRAAMASMGLITCSAMLVHLMDGYIEMHFHFFVMVVVISLYQDWVPFLLAISYVVAHHGTMGVLAPEGVYNHPDAIAHPWKWAAIHGAFVLAASAASVVNWRLNEAARARSELLLQSAGEGIFGINPKGTITFINAAGAEMLGGDAEHIAGQPAHNVLHSHAAGQAQHAIEDCPITLVARDGVARQGDDERFQTGAGEGFPAEYTCTPIREWGALVGAVVTFRDITDRRRYEERLTYQALYDPLTELPNRRLFQDRLGHALVRAARQHGAVAVLFMDLDRFKVVNDSLGHAAGDALLIGVAGRLAEHLRPSDTLARLGGDEFALLIEDIAHPSDALRIADRILEAVKRPIQITGHELVMSISIGITLRTPATAYDQPDDPLRDGDIAMYQAKAAGGGCAVLFDSGMNAPARERLEMETDLHRATERGELEVYYQPEVELATGAIVGMEALIRWNHPRRGLLGPGEFIPLAEETGLIFEVGRWVLSEACRQLAIWQAEDPNRLPLMMSVNLSVRQCRQPDLVEQVARILEEHGVDPTCLRLEVTESVMMEDVEATIATLHALRALGVRLAIDDFGMGYSSLSYLHRLPAETLKIDKSFIAAIDHDEGAMSIIRAVRALALALNMDVTAEGIETGEQLAHTQRIACERGQGYLFSRPLPAEALGQILRTGMRYAHR